MSEPTKVPALIAIDINEEEVQSSGIAYFRITPELRQFLQKCEHSHGILGFEWDGTFNFGVILRNDEEIENKEKTNQDSVKPRIKTG